MAGVRNSPTPAIPELLLKKPNALNCDESRLALLKLDGDRSKSRSHWL
jgi:hypothetical protein